MQELEPTGDVIDPEQTSDNVIVDEGDDTPVEAQQQITEEPSQELSQAPEKEVPIQNREIEWQRKYQNLVDQLPEMVEKVVSEKNKPVEQEYTVAQLEQYALNNPEYRPWVEEEKLKILEKRNKEFFQNQLAQERQQQKAQMIRQQAEQEVLNDPRYADAFTTTPNGQKTYNPNSQLAQLMGQYLNDPRLKDDPESIRIAAKLAYADVVSTQTPKTQEKLTTLKRQNEKLKSKTMVEGSGVQHQQVAKDGYSEAVTRLSQTGTQRDAQKAIEAYFRKKGTIK